MATEEKNFGAAKKFGARYGRSLRNKFVSMEAEKNKKYACPSCNRNKVHRIATGIWACKKCGVEFTGRAYSIAKQIVLTEAVEKEELAEPTPEAEAKQKEEEKKEEKAEESTKAEKLPDSK